MAAEKAVNSQMLIIDRDRKLLRMRMYFSGMGEWFKPAVLKTAERMMNALPPFESEFHCEFYLNTCLNACLL